MSETEWMAFMERYYKIENEACELFQEFSKIWGYGPVTCVMLRGMDHVSLRFEYWGGWNVMDAKYLWSSDPVAEMKADHDREMEELNGSNR